MAGILSEDLGPRSDLPEIQVKLHMYMLLCRVVLQITHIILCVDD